MDNEPKYFIKWGEKMKLLDEIIRFINEKILKKGSSEIMMLPASVEIVNDGKVDFSKMFEYLRNRKYNKELSVSFFQIKPSIRKIYIQKIKSDISGEIGRTHDSNILLEGIISNDYFIAIQKINLPTNRLGMSIIKNNSYIDITTKIINQDNYFSDLQYKEYVKNADGEELYKFDAENESYYKRIKKYGIIFREYASYGDEQELNNIEKLAQPTDNGKIIEEYNKLTGLAYISGEGMYTLSNALKANPYIVTIEAFEESKNGEVVHRMAITKIFSSKKECIVGYRPEMILLEGIGQNKTGPSIFRLLPEGIYVDNTTFKKNFEGKYSYKTISLENIQSMVKDIPFSLTQETKNILRNGLKIPDYLQKIYSTGIDKIKNIELTKKVKDVE